MKTTYIDFWQFLKKPTTEIAKNQTFGAKMKALLYIFLLELPVMAVLMGIISLIEHFGWFDIEGHKMIELIKSLPFAGLVVTVIVIVPFFEEIIFRIYLKYKRNYVFRFIVLIASFFGKKSKNKVDSAFRNLYAKKFNYILYTSAIIFGYVHITNYESAKPILWVSPFLVAPQIVMGLFLAYLRVKYNLFLGMGLHAVHNAVFMLIPLYFMLQPIVNINTDTYNLKIEEVVSQSKKATNSKYFFKPKEIKLGNTSIKEILSILLGINSDYLKCSNPSFFSKKLNVYFEDLSGEVIPTNTLLLERLQEAYKFSVEKDTVLTEVWELVVQDSLLLSSFQMDTLSNKTKVTCNQGFVDVENLNLPALAMGLTKSSNGYFSYENEDDKDDVKYHIRLEFSDFDDLKDKLRNKFGLALRKTKKDLVFHRVVFSDENE